MCENGTRSLPLSSLWRALSGAAALARGGAAAKGPGVSAVGDPGVWKRNCVVKAGPSEESRERHGASQRLHRDAGRAADGALSEVPAEKMDASGRTQKDQWVSCRCLLIQDTQSAHTCVCVRGMHSRRTWLILPVVICLFQGLSHANVRGGALRRSRVCVRLIKSLMIHPTKKGLVPFRRDNRANCTANTW